MSGRSIRTSSAPNISFSSHLFDALVHVDANGRLIPSLATSRRAVDPTTTWALRKGIKYAARTDEFTFAHQFAPE